MKNCNNFSGFSGKLCIILMQTVNTKATLHGYHTIKPHHTRTMLTKNRIAWQYVLARGNTDMFIAYMMGGGNVSCAYMQRGVGAEILFSVFSVKVLNERASACHPLRMYSLNTFIIIKDILREQESGIWMLQITNLVYTLWEFLVLSLYFYV